MLKEGDLYRTWPTGYLMRYTKKKPECPFCKAGLPKFEEEIFRLKPGEDLALLIRKRVAGVSGSTFGGSNPDFSVKSR